MARGKESAQERNARIRKEQQRLSEERSRRSLRTEDFQRNTTVEPVQRRPEEREIPRSSQRRVRPEMHVNTNRQRRQKAASRRAESSQNVKRKVIKAAAVKNEKKQSQAVVFDVKHETDFTLIACIILLSFIGLVMVTSSSYYHAFHSRNGDSLYFFRKQGAFLLAGMGAMIAATYFPIKWIKKWSWVVYAAAVFFTIIVLIIGKEVNGSKRWIEVGPIQFQPAEIAKLGIALFMAIKVEQYQKTIRSFSTFIRLMILLMIPTIFVMYQNLSSGLIIAVIGMSIMFVGGCHWKYFVILIGIGIAAFVVLIVLPASIPVEVFPDFLQGFIEKFKYRSDRIEAYIDPFKYAQGIGYQTVQSLYAIGSGGLFGAGLGESVQKLGFIPEAYNDIIFAIICEELGLVGAAIIILLYGILVKKGIQIAIAAPDLYTSFAATGLSVQVGIQAIMNIAVNTNVIPATGASLPFISYGGTSMIFLLGSMGILINISRYTRNKSRIPVISE